jgi:hypothetical protein
MPKSSRGLFSILVIPAALSLGSIGCRGTRTEIPKPINYDDTVATLKSQPSNDSLVEAVFSGKFDKVKLLVEQGVAINSSNNARQYTPLDAAMFGDDPRLIEYLIGKGAAVNALSLRHSTPLTNCLSGADVEKVRILLQHGADPNRLVFGNHPLEYWIEGFCFFYNSCPEAEAYNDRQIQILELLLDKGANPNFSHMLGKSILEKLEAKYAHPGVFDFFHFNCEGVSFEEDLRTQISEGGVKKNLLPIYQKKKEVILALLRKHGAKETVEP